MPTTYSFAVEVITMNPAERWEVDLQTDMEVDDGELMDWAESTAHDRGQTFTKFAKAMAINFAARVKVTRTNYGRSSNPLRVVAEFVGTDPVAIMARPLYAALKGLVEAVAMEAPPKGSEEETAILIAMVEAQEVLKQVSGRA